MEQKRPYIVEQIPLEDWKKTPASVQKLVEGMGQQIESLEKQLAQVLIVQQQLEEKANGTSKNSSSPPSADPPEKLFDLWHRMARINCPTMPTIKH